jgi:hypothetical protein
MSRPAYLCPGQHIWVWGRLRHSPGRHKTPPTSIYASRPEYAPVGQNIVILALLAGASLFWAGIGSSWPIPAGPALSQAGWAAGTPAALAGPAQHVPAGLASSIPTGPISFLLRLGRALPLGRAKQAAPASSALPPGRAGAGRPGLVCPSTGPRWSRPPRPRPAFPWATTGQVWPVSTVPDRLFSSTKVIQSSR